MLWTTVTAIFTNNECGGQNVSRKLSLNKAGLINPASVSASHCCLTDRSYTVWLGRRVSLDKMSQFRVRSDVVHIWRPKSDSSHKLVGIVLNKENKNPDTA